MNAIECRGVTLEIGRARVLRDVSFDIACAELVALVGPNGAGKSSLLRVIAGEIAPVSGTVMFLEKPLHEWSDRDLARRRAFLTQRTIMSTPFRVEDVVAIGRAPHDDENRTIIAASMEAAGVTEFRERSFATLSGGEAQRVQLARVLAQLGEDARARLLLLDEPTAALDLEHQHTVLAIARSLSRRGAAVAVVLHDLNLAAQYADRIVALRAGRVVADGTPAEVLTTELLRTTFRVEAQVLSRADGTPVITAGRLKAS